MDIRKLTALLTMSLLSLTQNAQAQSYNKADIANKAYDAYYDSYTGGTVTPLHMSCDGKGHIRSESTVQGMKIVSISDYKNNVTYSISDPQRTVTKTSMDLNAGSQPKTQETPLGTKMVDGHMCQGTRVNSGGHMVENWIDNAMGVTVLSTIDGKPSMKLKKTGAPLPASAFALPAGYKVVDMGDQMRKYQEMAKQMQGGKVDYSKLQQMYGNGN